MQAIKESTLASYIVVVFVYILASVVGVLVYQALTFDWWWNLLIADVVSTAVTYVFSVIFSNASMYDAYWSVQPLVIIGGLAIGQQMTPFRILLIIVIFIWGIRLTVNWAYTFPNLTHQDWRYTMIAEKTGCFYQPVSFLGIHLFPTIVVYLCVLPAAYAFINWSEFHPLNAICLAVSLGAAILQGIADFQMHRFRKNRTGSFIRDGLWKYSRHPNYLGEILMWWGVALSVVSVFPSRWYLIVGAVVNNIMFLVVSIPMADKRQARKPGFEEYKRETNMLLPIKKIRCC